MTKPRNKSIKRLLAAIVMAVNSFVVFCSTIAGAGFKIADSSTVWTVGLIFTFVLLATPGILGKPWSYWFASVLQLGVLLIGIWLPAMWFVGGLVACLWVWAMIAGTTIDRAKAALNSASMGQTFTVEAKLTEAKEVE